MVGGEDEEEGEEEENAYGEGGGVEDCEDGDGPHLGGGGWRRRGGMSSRSRLVVGIIASM